MSVTRDAFFRKYASPDQKGVEIGPSYNPVFPKREGWDVLVVDYLDQAGLVAKYGGGAADVSRIEPVDHLVEGSRFSQGLAVDQVDYIALSHALEHLPDPIAFFQECAGLLPIGGRVILAVPDKRFCFDLFRPITTTGQIVQAYWDGDQKHPASCWLDNANLNCTSCGFEEWVIEHERPALKLSYPHSGGVMLSEATDVRNENDYRDMHRWVFTPSSVLFLLRDLADQGLIEFEVEAIERGQGPNIFIALRRTENPPAFGRQERLHLQLAILMESEVQNAWVASAGDSSNLPTSPDVDPMTRSLMASARTELAYLQGR